MTLNVVTNSGPLMVFSKLNILHLLKELYGQVAIPKAVYYETVIMGMHHGFPDAQTLRLFLRQNHWHYENIEIPNKVANLNLDVGEKEAIALAISRKALLLIDEERGREIVRKENLTVKGSLGVLIEAYRKKLVTDTQLKFYFEEIMMRTDIWISTDLCVRLLDQIFREPV